MAPDVHDILSELLPYNNAKGEMTILYDVCEVKNDQGPESQKSSPPTQCNADGTIIMIFAHYSPKCEISKVMAALGRKGAEP
jgi:hypothetical protein